MIKLNKKYPLILFLLCISCGLLAIFLGFHGYTTAGIFLNLFIFLLILSLIVSGINLIRKKQPIGANLFTFIASFTIILTIVGFFIFFVSFVEFGG